MPDLATRLVTANFPGFPNGGSVPAGSRVEATLSQPVFNVTNGKAEDMTVVAPINPATGDMGFWDTVGTPAAGLRLFCNDDPNAKPQGTYWKLHFVIPGQVWPDLAVVVSTGDTDPVLLSTLAQPVGGTVAYGVQFDDGTTTLPNVSRVTVTNGTLSGTGNHAIVATGGGGGGSAHIIEDEGVSLTARTKLNFIGAGVTATDNAGANSTDVTIPAATTSAVGAVQLATPSSDVTAGHVVQASDARLSDARAPSTPTTKGDLVGFSTVPARVPVGTNGQQLIADSTQALGLRWDAIVKEFSWTATGYGYFQAGTAMTLDQAVTPNGTFAYDKASAGALGTFSSTSLPVVLAAGDVLRVNCSALANSYGALVLKRTA